MPRLEIPDNVITLEKVVAFAERTGRRLADFYYKHVDVEVHGHTPHIMEHEYFLSFGIDFLDQRPWKSVTYHIPQVQQYTVFEDLGFLVEKYTPHSYYDQTIRRRWVLHHLFVGRHHDEDGFALIDAQISENAVQKIKYFHGRPFAEGV